MIDSFWRCLRSSVVGRNVSSGVLSCCISIYSSHVFCVTMSLQLVIRVRLLQIRSITILQNDKIIIDWWEGKLWFFGNPADSYSTEWDAFDVLCLQNFMATNDFKKSWLFKRWWVSSYSKDLFCTKVQINATLYEDEKLPQMQCS